MEGGDFYVIVATKSLCLGLSERLSYLRYAEWCKYLCVFKENYVRPMTVYLGCRTKCEYKRRQ